MIGRTTFFVPPDFCLRRLDKAYNPLLNEPDRSLRCADARKLTRCPSVKTGFLHVKIALVAFASSYSWADVLLRLQTLALRHVTHTTERAIRAGQADSPTRLAVADPQKHRPPLAPIGRQQNRNPGQNYLGCRVACSRDRKSHQGREPSRSVSSKLGDNWGTFALDGCVTEPLYAPIIKIIRWPGACDRQFDGTFVFERYIHVARDPGSNERPKWTQ